MIKKITANELLGVVTFLPNNIILTSLGTLYYLFIKSSRSKAEGSFPCRERMLPCGQHDIVEKSLVLSVDSHKFEVKEKASCHVCRSRHYFDGSREAENEFFMRT
ncbi:hypothetical protein OKW21_003884 [Catalinimonas alkaloidigena]|uniref:hypothetical protein n=1 Tax=Catalinimonas alkaloidigena TaxID=1075417 RepID=UPI00240516FB|nr:hypothetical protein [Catalinimonas alkaloidigena]MDF9798621.1 hypothetical protein [Catalinimonas alkaloidigena]